MKIFAPAALIGLTATSGVLAEGQLHRIGHCQSHYVSPLCTTGGNTLPLNTRTSMKTRGLDGAAAEI